MCNVLNIIVTTRLLFLLWPHLV